jgi:SAM-dependent methyltransferase
MRLLPDLSRREREPEIMDRPDLDTDRHRHALDGLGRINRWSASAGILWPALQRLAFSGDRPLQVLDIATGGGDIPIRLWQWAKKAQVPMDIEACDISATALEYARENARRAGAEVRFFHCDVLREPLTRRYDAVISSLFLHHLDEPDAVALLRRAADAADRAVLINDLRRGTLAWWFAWLGTRILTRSRVVHVDGPLSVRAAFTIAEAQALARQAGLEARVEPRWPFRFLFTWHRNGEQRGHPGSEAAARTEAGRGEKA